MGRTVEFVHDVGVFDTLEHATTDVTIQYPEIPHDMPGRVESLEAKTIR